MCNSLYQCRAWNEFPSFRTVVMAKLCVKTLFKVLDVTTRRRRCLTRSASQSQLNAVYPNKLPISGEKKKDLLALCSSGAIPDVYHNFFASPPPSNEIVETLQEPDDLDESEPENDEFIKLFFCICVFVLFSSFYCCSLCQVCFYLCFYTVCVNVCFYMDKGVSDFSIVNTIMQKERNWNIDC